MSDYGKMSEYHRGYVDGTKSMDAERASVVSRLRDIEFVDDELKNLLHVASVLLGESVYFGKSGAAMLRKSIINLLGGAYLADTPGYKGELEEIERLEQSDYLDESGVAKYHKELRRMLGEARSVAHDLRQSRQRYEAQDRRNERLERENKMLRDMLNDAAGEYKDMRDKAMCHLVSGVASLFGADAELFREKEEECHSEYGPF